MARAGVLWLLGIPILFSCGRSVGCLSCGLLSGLPREHSRRLLAKAHAVSL
jgi:hypothetical protein